MAKTRNTAAYLVGTALLVAGVFLVSNTDAVWPGHVEYSLGILDGTDGFVVTAESSAGRLGYSVAGAGVRRAKLEATQKGNEMHSPPISQPSR